MATATPLALYWIYRGRKYSVLFATLPFEQRTDYTGRPSSPVLPGLVRFGLDPSDDTADLADYMFDPHQRAHSHFEAEYAQGSIRRWLDVQRLFSCATPATSSRAGRAVGPARCCSWACRRRPWSSTASRSKRTRYCSGQRRQRCSAVPGSKD